MIDKIQFAFDEAKNNNDLSIFEEFLTQEKASSDAQYICDITWSVDDIKSIRPEWSDEECAEAARYVAKVLQDRSTEEGWQILEDLLCFKTQDETNKECVA